MKNYVKAVVSFLFLMVVVAVVPVTSQAAVPAPTNVRQTDGDRSSVEVSWQAIPDADTYFTQWSLDGKTWGSSAEQSSSPKDTLYNLSAGSTYYVRVGACEGGWSSDVSDVAPGAWSAPIEVVTAPDYSQIATVDVNVGAATQNALPFAWTACPGATYYNLYNGRTDEFIGTSPVPSFTWAGLMPGTGYYIKIQPVKVSSSGFEAKTSGYKSSDYFYTRPETPVTPTVGEFHVGNAWTNIKLVDFVVNKPTIYDGYELEVYTVKGNKKAYATESSLGSMSVKKNTAYKFRCRYYNKYDDQRIYGGWSGYRYFWFHSVNGTRKNGTRINLSWGKVTNAKNYTIYISTSKTGGFKKVKTVGAKTTKITIRKYGKKKINRRTKYYVKVVAKAKDGKKVISSDVNWQGETLG